jgi:hypothetical protein
VKTIQYEGKTLVQMGEGFDAICIEKRLIDAFDRAFETGCFKSSPEIIVAVAFGVMGTEYDSIDREGLFRHAAEKFGLDYGVIYDAWLDGAV